MLEDGVDPVNALASTTYDGIAIRPLYTAEDRVSCCYALQDKVWVTAPGGEPWETYVVKADADVLDKAENSACCAPATGTEAAAGPAASACCQPRPRSVRG